jgi:replicative DNA helicase
MRNSKEIQLLPQNLEAEEAILGGLIIDPNALVRVVDLLTPGMFAIAEHQLIYRSVLALYEQGTSLDLLTLTSWLGDRGLLESVGLNRIVKIVDSTVSSVNVDQYALLVREAFRKRQIINLGAKIAELGYDRFLSSSEAIEVIQEEVFSLLRDDTKKEFVSAEEGILEVFELLEKRCENPDESGLKTGYYDLDELSGGFSPSDLVIVAGRPSMGKTAFSTALATVIASRYQIPVAIFSLEMSVSQLLERILSKESGIHHSKIRQGNIAKEDWHPIMVGIGNVSKIPIFIDDSASPTLSEMKSKLLRLKIEQGGLGVVVIDYLQLMSNDVKEISQITRGLKVLARELEVTIILLSQLNRQVESRTNKRPMMSDLRDSGSIEQDADLVMMVYRDEYYNPDSPDRGIMEVNLVKHRNGPTGVVKLIFDPAVSAFRNLAK